MQSMKNFLIALAAGIVVFGIFAYFVSKSIMNPQKNVDNDVSPSGKDESDVTEQIEINPYLDTSKTFTAVVGGYDADLLPEPGWDAADPTLLPGEVFLEGKYINDTFRNCTVNGRSCVEKISSKAVWSVRNEFDIGRKIHAAATAVTPEFLAYRYFPAPMPRASVAAEKIAGPDLTELLRRGLSTAQADSFAADLLTLADALRTTGIVHRDLFTDNLLLGADGHLKAIDWQLAIERDRYQEDDWVRRHWKFRYVVFGVNRDLPLGHWNDFRALAAVLAQFPQTKAVAAARERLLAEAEGMTFAAPPNIAERLKLFGYAVSLRLQMLLRGKRHRKYAQLERRYRTIVKRPAGGGNG